MWKVTNIAPQSGCDTLAEEPSSTTHAGLLPRRMVQSLHGFCRGASAPETSVSGVWCEGTEARNLTAGEQHKRQQPMSKTTKKYKRKIRPWPENPISPNRANTRLLTAADMDNIVNAKISRELASNRKGEIAACSR